MNNWIRLGISGLISAALTIVSYLYPQTPLLYYFTPGFWLSNFLPESIVNALGGYLFPVYASGVVWALCFFLIWLLARRIMRRR